MNVSQGDVAYTTEDATGTCGGEPCVVARVGTVVIVASFDWSLTIRHMRAMWRIEPLRVVVRSENNVGETWINAVADRILRRIKPRDDNALRFSKPKELVES